MAAAGLFGIGIGGVMLLLPVAWADYFGRESYGAIRGVALSLQVPAQAAGPLAIGPAARLERHLHRFAAAVRHPGLAGGDRCARRAAAAWSHGSVVRRAVAQRAEEGADVLDQEVRLLERREVPAARHRSCGGAG